MRRIEDIADVIPIETSEKWCKVEANYVLIALIMDVQNEQVEKMNKIRLLSIISLAILIQFSCSTKVQYLDQEYPGLIPKKYAKGIVNVEGRHQQGMTMSPDGGEQLFGLTESQFWRYSTILRVKRISANETVIDTPQFVKNFKYERAPVSFIGCAMISPDNDRLYFIADYPPDIFYATRTSSGDWSGPVKMDSISTEAGDWYISVTRDRTLYFNNESIFRSPVNDEGEYTESIPVTGPFNEEDAGDPFISPDEDYVIFPSIRDAGYGQGDLYVAFRDKNGNWSDAYNLGDAINTEDFEGAPYISPDGKFLFFTRRESWQNAGYTNIYWVNMEVVENIRERFED